MNPEISVVIPVYNGQAHIAKTLDSVLRQTCKPSEIIVVNDGSTDDTLDVLLAYASEVTIITTPNRGVSRARNTGVKAATSELIAFLDADDEWRSNKLEKQADFLAAHPEAGICCCDYTFTDDGAPESTYFAYLERIKAGNVHAWASDPLSGLIRVNFVGTASTVLIRRSLLRVCGGFDAKYKQAEDYDLWIRCALHGPFAIMPDTLVRKNRHASNLTNNHAETIHFHELVLEDHRDRHTFARCAGGRAEAMYALAKTRYQMANVCFHQKQYVRCVRYCAKALLTEVSFRNAGLFSYYVARKCFRIFPFRLLRTQ
jgi:glycosyltransferase involved in cell wall biosynthesis